MQNSINQVRACLACTHFGLNPALPAVDQTGASSDEADTLCSRDRARMTEGYCVLCGRREAWLVLHDQSDIGACRPCYVARFDEDAAKAVEATWEALDAGFASLKEFAAACEICENDFQKAEG